MSYYSAIDPAIEAWRTRHSLPLSTSFKDTEVRTTELVSATGERFQIWIDPPNPQEVGVHAWDYKKMRRDWNVPITQLGAALDESVRVVRGWMQGA